jgi:transcriptional regulator with XRE-family HTH domain
MDMFLFACRLKEVRERRNISAEELAEAIGVNKATVHRYEAGYFKSIKQNRLDYIAEFLNVSKSYLAGDSSNMYYKETINSVFEVKPRDLSEILNISIDLLTQDDIIIEGKPVNKDNINALIHYMEFILELAKKDKED